MERLSSAKGGEPALKPRLGGSGQKSLSSLLLGGSVTRAGPPGEAGVKKRVISRPFDDSLEARSRAREEGIPFDCSELELSKDSRPAMPVKRCSLFCEYRL